ncbi:MAG: hypothetical protein FD130_1341 [Halothiobacillaceae bacterium]|nr:MAG: hypothetical protein FD130_1341 [Halothiobacillaceae bacterium]
MMYCGKVGSAPLQQLLGRYGLTVAWVAAGVSIPGSHFGDPEAGLIGDKLLVRDDTPLHSALHEACHFVCMDDPRRATLHTDAGGDYDEESGVCYLQILLSDFIDGMGREKAFSDMDAWGYSFRLGSSRRWFYEDAEDARMWLLRHQLITAAGEPTWQVRDRLSVLTR